MYIIQTLFLLLFNEHTCGRMKLCLDHWNKNDVIFIDTISYIELGQFSYIHHIYASDCILAFQLLGSIALVLTQCAYVRCRALANRVNALYMDRDKAVAGLFR